MTRSLASARALRRANPRFHGGFAQTVDACAEAVRARLLTAGAAAAGAEARERRPRPGRASLAGASLAVVAIAATSLVLGSLGGTPGVGAAAAAIEKAAAVSSASAERSGTAVLRITRNGEIWGAATIRWNGNDLSVTRDEPSRAGKAGSALLLVDGTLYAIDPRDGKWVDEGSPSNIDPGSGTTPADLLAAVREDVGGATLRRFGTGVTDLSARRLADGSTLYEGSIAAQQLARENGFKEGQSIRVLPFGYVAHGDAADPTAELEASVAVGTDGLVRSIAASWGGDAAWTYRVEYSNLAATPAPPAPQTARSLLGERRGAAAGG